MKNHPIADLFPMLPEDELKELAADIKERGLLQPVVLDSEGRILDGRNRYAACDLAGLKPDFVTYEGEDPSGFALAVNIARRHLTKGQQAMVVARARSLSEQSVRSLAAATKVSTGRISQAAVVLEHAPDLVDAVVAGATPLNDAYATACDRKKAKQSTETKMADLRAKAPDLADQVTEERLTLNEAIAAHIARKQKDEEERRDAHELLNRALNLVAPNNADPAFVDAWVAHLGDVDTDTVKRIDAAITTLTNLREKVA